MKTLFSRPASAFLPLALAFFLGSCLSGCATNATSPETDKVENAQESASEKPLEIDRVGNSPASLFSYYQALSFFTPSELLQEKRRLQQSGDAPDTQLRLAMVLGHPQQPAAELKRASAILANLMKARDSVSYYLRPTSRMLADSYNERLRLEQQINKQTSQLEKQYQRLLEMQRHSSELQGKLESLADIERSLPRSRTNKR